MNYRMLRLRKLRLRRLTAEGIYQRRQKYFTLGLFIAMFLLAWLGGPNL